MIRPSLGPEECVLEPFLKWPGGKRWLADRVVRILGRELTGTYYEPFLGAGAVFFRAQPPRAKLSDKNADLIACLKTIARDPEEVIRAVWRSSNTRECYYRVRKMQPRTAVGAAARFVYLNRTCWGGIYRTNREGKFNVPYGNNGRVICHGDRLRKSVKMLRKASIKCCDFEEAMQGASDGDVVYADPPYTTRGADNGFVHYNEHLFTWEDQIRLAEVSAAAAKRGAFVAVSGTWQKDMFALYSGWWAVRLPRRSLVARSPANRKEVLEALFLSKRPVGVTSRLLP